MHFLYIKKKIYLQYKRHKTIQVQYYFLFPITQQYQPTYASLLDSSSWRTPHSTDPPPTKSTSKDPRYNSPIDLFQQFLVFFLSLWVDTFDRTDYRGTRSLSNIQLDRVVIRTLHLLAFFYKVCVWDKKNIFFFAWEK